MFPFPKFNVRISEDLTGSQKILGNYAFLCYFKTKKEKYQKE